MVVLSHGHGGRAQRNGGDGTISGGDGRRAADAGWMRPDRRAASQAGRYCRDGNPDKPGALQACNLLLEKNPAAADRARYLAARGFAYTRTEHYAEGIADLSASLELAPDNISARLERAKAELKTGDTQAARADYDQILAEAPWTFDAWMARARMDLEGGEYQLAVADLTEALTIRAERGDALVLRASAYRKLNEPKAAIADLSEAIRLQPDRCQPLSGSGRRADACSGDDAAALADAQTAIGLDATSVDAYAVSGYIQLQAGAIRCGHRRLRSRRSARSGLGRSLSEPRLCPPQTRRRRSGHRGLYQGDRAARRSWRRPIPAVATRWRRRATTTRRCRTSTRRCGSIPTIHYFLSSRGNAEVRLGRIDAALADFDQAIRAASGLRRRVLWPRQGLHGPGEATRGEGGLSSRRCASIRRWKRPRAS